MNSGVYSSIVNFIWKIADNRLRDIYVRGRGELVRLSADAFPSREFGFMLSNSPYGKRWEADLERLGGKPKIKGPRFVIHHIDEPEYNLVVCSSDEQLMFLVSKLSKMKQ